MTTLDYVGLAIVAVWAVSIVGHAIWATFRDAS
jgi:hypothetical protein